MVLDRNRPIPVWIYWLLTGALLVLVIALSAVGIEYQGVLHFARPWPDGIAEVGRLLLLALTGLIALYVMALGGTILVTSIVRLLHRPSNPDAMIVDNILVALAMSSRQDLWIDVGFRREIMSRLDDVASCMERDIPRVLKTRDLRTNAWLSEQWGGKAAAVRSLEQWLITPKPDTRERLEDQLTMLFRRALLNDWDAMAHLRPEDPPHPSWTARLKTGLKTVLIAILPLVLLLALGKTNVAVTGALGDYLKIGAIIWALVTLISLLDPLYAIKLTAIRDAIDLLRNKSPS
jgi:hypothetical protein